MEAAVRFSVPGDRFSVELDFEKSGNLMVESIVRSP
jgi:hypothetical protein